MSRKDLRVSESDCLTRFGQYAFGSVHATTLGLQYHLKSFHTATLLYRCTVDVIFQIKNGSMNILNQLNGPLCRGISEYTNKPF